MKYIINVQAIADELEFDLEDVEMIMDSFVQNFKINLENMLLAIQTDNLEDVKLSAHAIKGSAQNILLDDIGKLAKVIEDNARNRNTVNYLELYEELKGLYKGLFFV
ncbi:Hpt domain-containing protein [Sulfurimonas sp.]|uniref:Hpt domain-containing protein n=1 Tax=Sulfurimonas sp. TaxID=2022749 RepID=UPI0039E25856